MGRIVGGGFEIAVYEVMVILLLRSVHVNGDLRFIVFLRGYYVLKKFFA